MLKDANFFLTRVYTVSLTKSKYFYDWLKTVYLQVIQYWFEHILFTKSMGLEN